MNVSDPVESPAEDDVDGMKSEWIHIQTFMQTIHSIKILKPWGKQFIFNAALTLSWNIRGEVHLGSIIMHNQNESLLIHNNEKKVYLDAEFVCR